MLEHLPTEQNMNKMMLLHSNTFNAGGTQNRSAVRSLAYLQWAIQYILRINPAISNLDKV